MAAGEADGKAEAVAVVGVAAIATGIAGGTKQRPQSPWNVPLVVWPPTSLASILLPRV